MTINDFILAQTDDFIMFHRFWNDAHQNDAKNFPLNMNECDWLEQFAAWRSTEDNIENLP